MGRGRTVAEAVKKIGVTEQTSYQWKKKVGGLRAVLSSSPDLQVVRPPMEVAARLKSAFHTHPQCRKPARPAPRTTPDSMPRSSAFSPGRSVN